MTTAFELLTGDCREVMRGMSADSADAIVCDPPYGLSFMGRGWDHGVPGVEFWLEALRVLKPGGHLLAFGGTRTFHRLTCAIEDAGFEIRDCIMWVYGSGFPKSLDVSKSIDSRRDWSALEALQGKVRAAREALGISQSEAARRMGLIAEDATLGGGGFMWFETGRRTPTREQYPRLKAALDLDGACDAYFEEAEREAITRDASDMLGERTEAVTDAHTRLAIAPGQGEERQGRKLERTSAATDAARQWEGWGTALKPAWEPIIVARKAVAGTVAENVQRYGTGAINVDACRIGTNGEAFSAPQSDPANRRGVVGINLQASGDAERNNAAQRASIERTETLGRWPANLIHDGSDEVVALFPSEAGAFAPVRGSEPTANGFSGAVAFSGMRARVNSLASFHGDSGSAARFFYCAKASREDRNEGCEALERKPLNWSSGEASPGTFQAEGTDRTSPNNHPTVKPTDLMRYLVRLVTPSGGLVLDPFAGSGSTGKACVLEDFRFVGIDITPEYVEIARRRIAHAAAQPKQQGLELGAA